MSRPLLHGGEITAFDMLKSVKWEAHRGLLSSIPTMLRHLREDGINDSSLFLRKDHSMELVAGDLLRSFFNNQDKRYDMSVKKTREICAWRTPHVLACVIRNCVQFSIQPLIPSETCLRLLIVSGSLRSMPLEKRIEVVTEVVEEMSAWRFEILSSLMCFLKDCSSSKSDLARELGPIMLLREGVTIAPANARGRKMPELVREQNQINDEMAASEAFRFLIDESKAVFGIPVSSKPQRPHQHVISDPVVHQEMGIFDEEKTSAAQTANDLYAGIPAGGTRRRTKSKKASSFYNVISRTSSNVSRESNLGSDLSFYKSGDQSSKSLSVKSIERTGSSSTEISSNTTPPAKRPSGKFQPPSASETMSDTESSKDRRPTATSLSSDTLSQPEVAALLGNYSTSRPTSNKSVIKTQTSFSSQGSANPLIKTQTSFSTNSRPSTPTTIMAARRTLLEEITASNNESSPIQADSHSVTSTVDSEAPPPMPQKSISTQTEIQQPLATTAPAQITRSPVVLTNVKSVNADSSTRSRGQTTEMDADGPTIFEREMISSGQTERPPSNFEEELKLRATRSTLSIDMSAIDKATVQEEKSESPPIVQMTQRSRITKGTRPPTEKRHSFIPRITSPTTPQETKKELPVESRSIDAQQQTVVTESAATAKEQQPVSNFQAQLAVQKAIISNTPSREASPPPIENKPEARASVTSSPLLPRTSSQKPKTFEEILAERKAAAESSAIVPTPAASTTPQPPRATRAKPIPPRPTPAIRRMSIEMLAHAQAHQMSSPSPTANDTTPDMSMEDKLANLRALLKPVAATGSATFAEVPAPVAAPEDKKKGVPPPANPPPPGHPRMDKEGGVQIVGDWRTEFAPQYRAQFWVNILDGRTQWHHPMRERSLSTKAREEKAQAYAAQVTAVTVKVPEKRKTVYDNAGEEADNIVKAAAAAAASHKEKKKGAVTMATEQSGGRDLDDSRVESVKSIEEIGRQNSDIQKNLHKSYRRASLQSENFHAQQSAQLDEAESLVIAAARAAGELIAECIFDFNPVDSHNKAEMAIRVGEKLRIYEKGNDGWWGGVKVLDGRQRGLFPESYVRLI